MKKPIRVLLLLHGLFFAIAGHAQKTPGDYYTNIANFNLFELWRGQTLTLEGGKGATLNFPEPLGFIGNSYRRFYIHYSMIIKDEQNPHQYHVTGKTRVNNTICNFTGVISVKKAVIFKNPAKTPNQQGEVTADVYFKESPAQKESGYIKGTLITKWYLDGQGMLFYDTLDSQSDNWCNNQFTGTWTDYKSHQSKKCNWGDYRIPKSGGLDIGAGEFSINKKYVMNGWQSYHNLDNKDKAAAQKALLEEKRKWWL